MEFNLKNVRHNIGDKVVALTSNNHNPKQQKRTIGEVYTVKDVRYCCSCGTQTINIGQLAEWATYANCHFCKHENNIRGKHWTSSELFAPLQEIDNLMASAIEQENYELAQTLKEIKP